MSEARVQVEELRIPLERDELGAARTLGVIAATLAAIAVGVLWTWALMARGDPQRAPVPEVGASAQPETLRPEAIAGIRQSLIEERAGEPGGRRPPPRLQRFGWVDRERGVVRVPVEVAMDLWLRRHGTPRPSEAARREEE